MSEVLSASVPDEVVKQVEAEQAGDESKSAALRRIIRRGVEDRSRKIVRLLSVVAGIGFIIAYVLESYTGLVAVTGSHIIGLLLWSAWPELRRIPPQLRESVLRLSRDDAEADDGEGEVNA
jgi:hypothetical protein